MALVNRPVHADGGTQLLRCLVITDLPQNRHERGRAQVRRTRGDDLTHPSDGCAVLARRADVEATEHLFSTGQTFFVTAHRSECAHRRPFKSCAENRPRRRLLVDIDGADVAGLKAARGEELRCGLALEQQLLFGHLYQDETHKFSQVQAADHFLKPDM